MGEKIQRVVPTSEEVFRYSNSYKKFSQKWWFRGYLLFCVVTEITHAINYGVKHFELHRTLPSIEATQTEVAALPFVKRTHLLSFCAVKTCSLV